MNLWDIVLVWATFGFSLGAAFLVNLLLYSTTLSPLPIGAPKVQHVIITIMRLPFLFLAFLGIVVQWPLALFFFGTEKHGWPTFHAPGGGVALITWGITAVLTVWLAYKVLSKFVIIKTTSRG